MFQGLTLVADRGTWETGYRAVLWLRSAIRVLACLSRAPFDPTGPAYDQVQTQLPYSFSSTFQGDARCLWPRPLSCSPLPGVSCCCLWRVTRPQALAQQQDQRLQLPQGGPGVATFASAVCLLLQSSQSFMSTVRPVHAGVLFCQGGSSVAGPAA